MNETDALIELLGGLVSDMRFDILVLLLAAASVCDIRNRKIPNRLTAGGLAAALFFAAVPPFSLHGGLAWALTGCALGLLIMLPLYYVKAMGAGDVKLMAVVGAFVGPYAVFHIALVAFIVGGIFALGFALMRGLVGQLLGNVWSMVLSRLGSAAPGLPNTAHSIGKMPYGVSIAVAAIAYLVARQIGYA